MSGVFPSYHRRSGCVARASGPGLQNAAPGGCSPGLSGARRERQPPGSQHPGQVKAGILGGCPGSAVLSAMLEVAEAACPAPSWPWRCDDLVRGSQGHSSLRLPEAQCFFLSTWAWAGVTPSGLTTAWGVLKPLRTCCELNSLSSARITLLALPHNIAHCVTYPHRETFIQLIS